MADCKFCKGTGQQLVRLLTNAERVAHLRLLVDSVLKQGVIDEKDLKRVKEALAAIKLLQVEGAEEGGALPDVDIREVWPDP